MKNTNSILYLTLAAAMMLMASACSNDEPDFTGIPGSACYDIVTLEKTEKNVGTVFSMQKSQDSELIQYTSGYSFTNDTAMHTGRRLIIAYSPKEGEPYHTGAITLYGYRMLDSTYQPLATGSADDEEYWKSDAMKALSLTRTGQYINLIAMLSCTKAEAPKRLILAARPHTLDDPYPHLQVLYTAASPGLNSFTGYASFDISSIWDKESCKGVMVSYTDADGLKTTTFDK